MQKLDAVDAASLREDIPAFRAGDTVKVHVKVIEGNRSRIQVFQGVVIARRGHGVSETFTVRFLRCRCSSYLPPARTHDRQDRGRDQGRRAPRKALLPA